jgi:hypothetical protein
MFMENSLKKIGVGMVAVFCVLALSNTVKGAPDVGGVPQVLAQIVEALNNLKGATIQGADQAEGLVTNPLNPSENELVWLEGPGAFVSARMVKQGGASGLTAVSLEIDGKIVVQRNVAALKNWGMTQDNPFGVAVFTAGDIDTVTIGFQQPVAFEESLLLKAIVNEDGVVQIIGTVVYGQ